jgi:hypothetical protein
LPRGEDVQSRRDDVLRQVMVGDLGQVLLQIADHAIPDIIRQTGLSIARRVCIVRLDNNEVGTCKKCNRRLIEIDHYGERLMGSIDCNRWSWEGSKRLLMELPEEDLLALRDRVIRK